MRRFVVVVVGVLLFALQAVPCLARTALVDTDSDLVDDGVDNCVGVFNPFQIDVDGDGLGDLCDPDRAVAPSDGSDLLFGTAGDDALSGGAGGDSLYGDDSRALVMTAEESVDIDGPWDLELADWLLRRREMRVS